MYDLQLQSPFFARLPPEVRNHIFGYCDYHHIFHCSNGPGLSKIKMDSKYWPPHSHFPALLLTCKRAAEEVRNIPRDNAVLHIICGHGNLRKLNQRPVAPLLTSINYMLSDVGTWNPATLRSLSIIYSDSPGYGKEEHQYHLDTVEQVQRAFGEAVNLGFIHLHLTKTGGSSHGFLVRVDNIVQFMTQFPRLKRVVLSGRCRERMVWVLRGKLVGVHVEGLQAPERLW